MLIDWKTFGKISCASGCSQEQPLSAILVAQCMDCPSAVQGHAPMLWSLYPLMVSPSLSF
uniref:Uncharacterized protein n=1 Tax=Rhizophora mucronata TaxID=61149 RepID=A0A2P2NTR3_RHIMU